MKNLLSLGVLCSIGLCAPVMLSAQTGEAQEFWNGHTCLTPFRLPPAPLGHSPRYQDLNHDGKVDAIFTLTHDSIPVLWLDDDGNMRPGDTEGDRVNDCLLIDRNKDGVYDFIVKWADQDRDGKADLQLVAEYPPQTNPEVWPNGHYMIVLDTDKDNIFNYIDWNTFKLDCWYKNGICDFYPDYSGQTAFLKVHASTDRMEDLRLNWENPFLFYDPDKDGLTEMAIRLVDSPRYTKDAKGYEQMHLSGHIDWVSIAVDLDNDNGPEREFDFDFTLGFQGPGFDYTTQRHPLVNMRGLPEADKFFPDPRIRQLKELVYTDHDHAMGLIFGQGEWKKASFVYDEDDDCGRWERVEFCDNKDPFRVGRNNGGFDNHTQADPSGDRGEWDADNSGKGRLYISRFDGRLHLYGAENGIWRIDQNTAFYQGWDRKFHRLDPQKFATVHYLDTNDNGFFDQIEYDLDGDGVYETLVNLLDLGLDDRCDLVDVSHFAYKDFTKLTRRVSANMWKQAQTALKVAEHFGLATDWYAKLKQTNSVRERYQKSYWLQYYIYRDLEDFFVKKGNQAHLQNLHQCYFSANWEAMLKHK